MATNQSIPSDGNDVAVITGLLAQTLLTYSGVNDDHEQIESQASASASASAPTVTATPDDSVAAPVRQMRLLPLACIGFYVLRKCQKIKC